MMGITTFCKVFYILMLTISASYGRVPTNRLCADEKCQSIISIARTVINFRGSHPSHVSFRGNTQCRVMAKSIGENSDLWEIEVQGRRGYAPKAMIMEQKILVGNLIEVRSDSRTNELDSVEINAENVPIKEGDLFKTTNEQSEQQIDSISEKEEHEQEQTLEQDTNSNEREEEHVDTNSNEREEEHVHTNSNEREEEHVHTNSNEREEEHVNTNLNEREEEHVDPVEEPLTIKRYMYKTGDAEVNSESVRLEVVGFQPQKDEDEHVNSKIAADEIDEQISTEKEKIEIKKSQLSSNENVESKEIFESRADENVAITTDNGVNDIIETNEKNNTETMSSITELPKIFGNQFDSKENSQESIIQGNEYFESKLDVSQTSEHFENIQADRESDVNEITTTNVDEAVTNIQSNDSSDITVPSSTHDEISNEIKNTKLIEDNTEKENIIVVPRSQIEEMESNENLAYNVPKTIDVEQSDREQEINHQYQNYVSNIAENYISIVTTRKSIVEDKQSTIHDEVPITTTSPSPSPQYMDKHSLDQHVELEREYTKSMDIFSTNFQPETSSEIVESWFEDVLIYVEKAFSSVKNVFYSDLNEEKSEKNIIEDQSVNSIQYCENLHDGNSCPKNDPKIISAFFLDNLSKITDINSDSFLNSFLVKVIVRAELVVLLLLTASAILIFVFGHNCFVNHSRESVLIKKLNALERKLILSQKESSVTKAELIETSKKLSSIADKSFGSDDMIKHYEVESSRMKDQIASLEKELETAAEAGLELNKMISELLSNQSGSDSIINTVEELQHQLNEQEANTIYINNLLAEKSRENSELQVLLTDSNQKFGAEIHELLIQNDKIGTDKETIENTLSETIHSLEVQLRKSVETKTNIISNFEEEYSALRKEYDDIIFKWHTATAQAEALEESLRKLEKFNGKDDIKTVIEVTDANAKCIAMKKQNDSLRDQLDSETECKNRLQEQVKEISEDIARLRSEFNQNEKEKLEAQTRLEVLSSYFKEKESQLQKELGVKEALFMKQQGESTSTVERIQSLQDDIQSFRSQNDQLRAEIEAQIAAHKAQINAAEVRAHDSWLAAKQAERRLDEARAEASILRKKLTSLTFNRTSAENTFANLSQPIVADVNAPSPIHMESPSSPVLPLNLPPLPLIPAPLYANSGLTTLGAPFMPPPPLPLLNDMRPAPIGRLMSPPPPDTFLQQQRYRNTQYSDHYESETDFSPPRSPPSRSPPEFYRERNYRYSPEVPTKKKSSFARKGTSSESVDITRYNEV